MRACSYNLLERHPLSFPVAHPLNVRFVEKADSFDVLVNAGHALSKLVDSAFCGSIEQESALSTSEMLQTTLTGLQTAVDPQSRYINNLPCVELETPLISPRAHQQERRVSHGHVRLLSALTTDCNRSSAGTVVSSNSTLVAPLGSDTKVSNEAGSEVVRFGVSCQLEAINCGARFGCSPGSHYSQSCVLKCDTNGVCLHELQARSRVEGDIDRTGCKIVEWGSICATGMTNETQCSCNRGNSPELSRVTAARYDIYSRKKSAPTVLTGRATFFPDTITRKISCEDAGQRLNGSTSPFRSRLDAMFTRPGNWLSTRTPELKPRLGSAADSRRRTLSNLLDVSADSDARRLVLKKTKNIPDGVKKWADSFDLLLSDEGGVEVFRIFLRSEYSEENMRFYTACEELKHARSFRVGPRAKRIYKTFIEDHAPMEVNLDFETKKSIRDAMKSPHRTMFDEAQRKIREMLSADAYPRFIRSDFYKGLLNS